MRLRVARNLLRREFLFERTKANLRAHKRVAKCLRRLQVHLPPASAGCVYGSMDLSVCGLLSLLGEKFDDLARPEAQHSSPEAVVAHLLKVASYAPPSGRMNKNPLQGEFIVAYTRTGQFRPMGSELLKFHSIVGRADHFEAPSERV